VVWGWEWGNPLAEVVAWAWEAKGDELEARDVKHLALD
tara:strand:+ start:305 stop:418 length:114 start_codon:yes stop_codon:yes gene_type:complete